MPLNREWRDEAEEILAESPLDEESIASVEERMGRLSQEISEIWDSPAWAKIDEILNSRFAKESRIMFETESLEDLKLARERARVLSQIRKLPEKARKELQELGRERRTLLGEELPEE